MSLGEFEPDVWTPALHTAARRGTISLDELVRITDPPLRHSLPMDLAFAATAERPTAVLTGPSVIAGSHPSLSFPPAISSRNGTWVSADARIYRQRGAP